MPRSCAAPPPQRRDATTRPRAPAVSWRVAHGARPAPARRRREIVTTIADWIRERASEDATALLFEEERWSWRELAAEAAARAALLRDAAPDPPHVGVLLENVPEFVFWLAA